MYGVMNSFEALPGFEGLAEGERLMLGPEIQGVPKSCSFISIRIFPNLGTLQKSKVSYILVRFLLKTSARGGVFKYTR